MREYVLLFLVAAVVTYLLGVLAREAAQRLGAVARVRDRDVHAIPTPYFGGVAMLGGMVASYVVARQLPFLSLAADTVFRDAAVVLVAGALVCGFGVLDDVLELDALTKLGGQVLAAGLLVVFGVKYWTLPLPGGAQLSLDEGQAAMLTVLVVVASVNAVNFVDGLDGLAAGVVGFGAVGFFAFSYILAALNGESRAVTAALLCASLAGACAGFLPHNFFPARMFMGDSGSMLLGLVLSASTLTLTGQFVLFDLSRGVYGQASFLALVIPVLLPLSVMLVPFTDLVLAVFRRLRKGTSPFTPDKQHLHHQMLELGHSHRRAVLILWMWAALVSFGLVLASLFSGRLVVLALVAWLVLTIMATFALPRVHRPGRGVTPWSELHGADAVTAGSEDPLDLGPP